MRQGISGYRIPVDTVPLPEGRVWMPPVFDNDRLIRVNGDSPNHPGIAPFIQR
jgi:hypothetical protein